MFFLLFNYLPTDSAIEPFILSGSGTLRLGDEKIIIKENDYVALPLGREHAHQVINTSNEELIYLCISTMIVPDVMEYSDSDKVGIRASSSKLSLTPSFRRFF